MQQSFLLLKNVKLFNLHFDKLKSETKNTNEVTLKLSSNISCSSNYKTNFHHELILYYC